MSPTSNGQRDRSAERERDRRPRAATPPPSGELLTIKEASRALCYSVRSLRGYLNKGDFAGVLTPGRQWRIPRGAVVDEALRLGLQWARAELAEQQFTGGRAS